MQFSHKELRLLSEMGYDHKLLKRERVSRATLPPQITPETPGASNDARSLIGSAEADWKTIHPLGVMPLSLWCLLSGIVIVGIVLGQPILSVFAVAPLIAATYERRIRYRIQGGVLELHEQGWMLPLTFEAHAVENVEIEQRWWQRLLGTARVRIHAGRRCEERLRLISMEDAARIQRVLHNRFTTLHSTP
ncbi:MAG: PH domain-containing protein [Myxococcota bacterium]